MPCKIVEAEDDHYDDEDYYDAQGNVSPGGFYDAGGHFIGERFSAYADDWWDRERDRQSEI